MSSKRKELADMGPETAKVLADISERRKSAMAEAIVCSDCGAQIVKQFHNSSGLCMSAECQRSRTMIAAHASPWAFARKFGVPPGWEGYYKHARLSNFKGFDLSYDNANMFLHGPNGTGKTTMMAALAFEVTLRILDNPKLKDDWHEHLRWTDAGDIFLELRESFREKSKLSELEIVSRYAGYDVLFIDDLFAEHITDWTLASVCNILRKREQGDKQTIVTSNLCLEEVKERDPRIASLLGGYRDVELTGADRRKERA